MIKDVRLFISCGMTVGKVTSGYSIIETLGFKSFKKDLEPKLNNWLIGNQVELGSEYFFKNNFSICGSANINYSLNYLTNSTQIRNKPYWIGMKACLRYYFN
jgi:hypothetical protein